METVEEIKELKNSRVEFEAKVADSFQHVLESTTELDAVARVRNLGDVIEKLQRESNILDALIHPSTPPEKIATRKDDIEQLATQLDELEQDSKKVTDPTTQVWGSIV